MLRNPYDPRLYQIVVLASIMIYGTVCLDLETSLAQVIVILSGVLVTQFVLGELTKLPRFDPRSPLISGLSLCLLLRTNSLLLAAIASFIAIASKFFFRIKGKHLFNPTNFGLIAMMVLTNKVWVSPGQWGSVAFFGFLLACVGGLVVNFASRSDVTIAFFGFYVFALFTRALWLGDPLSIPVHQIQNGAFLIFTFFMISDPKTTPDSRRGRMVFALVVALGALFVQFVLYRPNGLLWSLAALSIFTPLIDYLFPGSRYRWNQSTATIDPITRGVKNETTIKANHNVPVYSSTG